MQFAKSIPMRHALLLAAIVVLPQSCFGQFYRDAVAARPHCDELPLAYPPENCHRPDYCPPTPPCDKAPPEQPRDAPEPTPPPTPRPAPTPQPTYQETGYYQAGPRSGIVEGASGTFGFRGGALTLPRLRLELPSIELPSLFHASHGATMRVRESVAPWVSTGFERVTSAVAAPATRSRDAAPPEEDDTPRARSTGDEECDALKAKYEEKIEELNRKLDECDRLRKSIEQSLCEQPKTLPNRFMPNQEPQCIPPGPRQLIPGQPQCPPGAEYCPTPGNQIQSHPLPPPATNGAGSHFGQPPTVIPGQVPQADPSSFTSQPQSAVAMRHAASQIGERASLQRPVGSYPRFDPAAPQPLFQTAGPSSPQGAIHHARPHVVPASHLGTPRVNSAPRLEPLPKF